MDKINIDGLRLTALDQIFHPDGDIFHGMKEKDQPIMGKKPSESLLFPNF